MFGGKSKVSPGLARSKSHANLMSNVLSESERRFHEFVFVSATLEASPIIFVSDGFLQRTQYDRHDIINKEFKNIIHDPNSVTSTFVLKKLTGRSECRAEIALATPKNPLWTAVRIIPVFEEDTGELSMYVVAIQPQGTVSSMNIMKSIGNDHQRAGIKPNESLASIDVENQDSEAKGCFSSCFKKEDSNTTWGRNVRTKVLSMSGTNLPDWSVNATRRLLLIDHTKRFKVTWDYLTLILVIYTAVAVPLELSYDLTDPLAIKILLQVWFWTDILVAFRTTYSDLAAREQIWDWKKIGKRYLLTWFLPDLIGAIPFEFIEVGSIGILKGLKSLRLTRLGRVVKRLDVLGNTQFQLAYFMMGFVLLSHWLACIWFAMANYERQFNQLSWLHRAGLTRENQADENRGRQYVAALYFCLSSITTVGFGNIAPHTISEQLFGVFLLLIGTIVYATIFGNVTTSIQRFNETNTRYNSRVRALQEFVEFYNVPEELKKRLYQYTDSLWEVSHGIDQNAVMGGMPATIRSEVAIFLHSQLVSKCQLFDGASPGFTRAVATHLKSSFCSPGEYIMHAGDFVDHLFFISSGNVEIVINEQVVSLLTEHDFFGEMSLKNGVYKSGKAHANVRAVSFCRLQCISHSSLLAILNKHSEYITKFQSNLIRTYHLRQGFAPPIKANNEYMKKATSVLMVDVPHITETVDGDSEEDDVLSVKSGSIGGVPMVRSASKNGASFISQQGVPEEPEEVETAAPRKPADSSLGSQIIVDRVNGLEQKMDLLISHLTGNASRGGSVGVSMNDSDNSLMSPPKAPMGLASTSVLIGTVGEAPSEDDTLTQVPGFLGK